MISNSYPSYLHVLAWLQTVCTLYNVGPFLLLACCHTAHAGLSEFRPDVMILVKRQGFIDFVNASASIRAVSIHHNSSPQGEYSRLLFWPFPVHKDYFNAASSIPSPLSWTFLGTSAFKCSTRLMQSDTQMCFIFIWHCSCQSVIDTNLPVISHRTHLRRSRAPLHSEVRTTQPAAWLCTHVSVSTKRIRSHGCCDLSPSGAKPWTDNEPCPAGI